MEFLDNCHGSCETPIECRAESVKMIEGISDLEHLIEKGGRELTFGGIHTAEIIDRFIYTYDGLSRS